VSIKAGVVYPPRGSGDNLNLAVYVEHDVGYPYDVEVTSGRMRIIKLFSTYAIVGFTVAATFIGVSAVGYMYIF